MTDIIIIGAGTAGMSAALYALRAGASVLLLESETIGGQISSTPKVENYPGIMQMSGSEFSSTLFDQVVRLGASYDLATVERIEKKENGKYFTVWADGKAHECKSVILATGVKPRKLGLEREDELIGEGVCFCAVCDGAFYMGQDVAVCGGGNSALTDALFLSTYCKKVYLIHRRGEFSAEKTLIDELKTRENIEILLNSSVTSLSGMPLDGVEILNASGVRQNLAVAALFVAVGHEPHNDIFKNIVNLDEKGFILAGEDCKTSAEGVFAAGDCRTKKLRQLSTATADGATSGLAAARYSSKIQ